MSTTKRDEPAGDAPDPTISTPISPPEPGDLADRAQDAGLDPDEPETGGDQDIDTAGTEADVEKETFRDGPASGAEPKR